MATLPKGQGVFLPPFKAWLASNIPAVYDNTMTYYEELVALIKYLQDIVVPAVNDNASAVTTISNAVEQLQSYVENYFANLDVQEEINNKLDEMAEDGTLQEIITEYIQANTAWCFDSVADMKNATNFVNGSYARTLGFHTLNDGGGALYKVRTVTNDDVVDEARIIALDDDTLIAELIPTQPLNVRQMGVVGDGTTDDTSAIQHVIDTSPRSTIYFPVGTYLVSATITTPATDIQKVFLELDANAIIKANDDFSDDFLIVVGGTGTADVYGNTKYQTGISGGILDCNGRTSGIKSINTHVARFSKLEILNCLTIGIQIDKSNNDSSDAFISDINIKGVDGNVTSTIGVNLNGYDNNIEMVRTTGFHTGFNINGGGNFLYNCHPLYSVRVADDNYNTSVGFNILRSDTTLTDCYADNFSTGIKCKDVIWYANNFTCFWYDDNASHEHTIITSTSTTFWGKVDGMNVHFPPVGTNRGLVIADSANPNSYYPTPVTTLYGNDTSGWVKNIHLDVIQWNRMTNKYVDPLLASDLRCYETLCLRGADDPVLANKYYPLMFIPRLGSSGTFYSQHYDIDFTLGTKFHVQFNFIIRDDKLYITKLDTVYNLDSIGFSFALAKPSGMNNAYVLYIKFNRDVSDVNKVFSTTITNIVSGARMSLIPRNAIYTNSEINGIDTLSGSLDSSLAYENQNVNAGVFNNIGLWSDTLTVQLGEKLANGSMNVRPAIMFIRWGSSTALYGYFNGQSMVIDDSHKSSSDSINFSYNSTSGVLTITLDKTGIMHYVRF